MTNSPSRYFELEGTYNFRDIGGYPTQDGHQTRWGKVYRSDSLHRLTPEGEKALLEDAGLRTIIDLRRQDELDAEPDVLMNSPAIQFFHVPILQASVSSGDMQAVRAVQTLEDLYRTMLDHYQPELRTVFERIGTSIANPVLVHCSAGKDRTGIVIALLLDLVKVAPEIIAEDYELTNSRIEPMLDGYRQKAAKAGLNMEIHERMLLCRADAMLATLEHLHSQYGGARAYLNHIGLSEEAIDTLYDALTGEARG